MRKRMRGKKLAMEWDKNVEARTTIYKDATWESKHQFGIYFATLCRGENFSYEKSQVRKGNDGIKRERDKKRCCGFLGESECIKYKSDSWQWNFTRIFQSIRTQSFFTYPKSCLRNILFVDFYRKWCQATFKIRLSTKRRYISIRAPKTFRIIRVEIQAQHCRVTIGWIVWWGKS